MFVCQDDAAGMRQLLFAGMWRQKCCHEDAAMFVCADLATVICGSGDAAMFVCVDLAMVI